MKDLEKLLERKRQNKESTIDPDEWDLLEHKRVLSQDPPKKLLKTNKQYGNKYVPLEAVEFMLNALYIHHEVIIPFPPVYIEGQILFVVNLIVIHPVSEMKLTYSGQSCVPIISPKHENSKYNHRNIPAGESFAIMNAAKKIGNIFNAERGDYADVMKPYFENKKIGASSNDVEVDRIKRMIKASKTLAQKKKLVDTISDLVEKKQINCNEYKELQDMLLEVKK